MKYLSKRVGVKFAKKIYGIIGAYCFLLCMVLMISSTTRGDTITIIEEVITTETITEFVDKEVTTTQTITESKSH